MASVDVQEQPAVEGQRRTSAAFGLSMMNRGAVFFGESYTCDDLLRNAVLAEELEFDFVSLHDSLLAKPRLQPIPLLGAIAALTKRLRIATGILQPHMRNPVLLAQEWATLDIISGGRTSLVVGLGNGPAALIEKEYQVVGVDRRRRTAAFEESIQLLRELWTRESVTYQGEIYEMEDIAIGYTPVQRPHPPILVAGGGYSPNRAGYGPNDFSPSQAVGRFVCPVDRVARLGDGWMTQIATPGEVRETLAAIRAGREALGVQDARPFDVRINSFINVGDEDASRAEGGDTLKSYHRLPMDDGTLERWLIYGPPERCAARIAAYIEAGVTSFQLVLASRDQRRQMLRVAESVLPLVH